MRLRLTIVAALCSLAAGLAAVPAASAASSAALPHTSIAPALKTIKVNGLAKNGKKFTGTYAIQGFLARHGKEYAVGTLRGMLKGRHVTRYNVLMPAKLTGASSSTGAPAAARDQTTPGTCSVLHLELGPINLNLLGLRVTLGGGAPGSTIGTQPIILDITAIPGNGNLLGNLLCDVTNALNQGGLLGQINSSLQQLTAVLNGLLGLLGGL
jgi:hypothetical protein